jgi:hypothetical protein
MAAEIIGYWLIPPQQDKNLGGALCGWHRPLPPNPPDAHKEWPAGREASIGPRGRGTFRSTWKECFYSPGLTGQTGQAATTHRYWPLNWAGTAAWQDR